VEPCSGEVVLLMVEQEQFVRASLAPDDWAAQWRASGEERLC
jgi:hypothetical protein